MPYYPPVTGPIIATSLGSVAILGLAVPSFSLGVAIGVAKWLPQVTVSTVDTGSAGVGTGGLPFAVPQPLLLGFLQVAFTSMGIIGVMAPLKVLGLANGLASTLAMAAISTTHTGVGTGTGIARFSGPPAGPSIILGLSEVGMTGPGTVRIGNAIGMGLTNAVLAYTVSVPIVGSASPISAFGTGVGKIL